MTSPSSYYPMAQGQPYASPSLKTAPLNMNPYINVDFHPNPSSNIYLEEEAWVRMLISGKKIYKTGLETMLEGQKSTQKEAQTNKLAMDIAGAIIPVQQVQLMLNPVDFSQVSNQGINPEQIDFTPLYTALGQFQALFNPPS